MINGLVDLISFSQVFMGIVRTVKIGTRELKEGDAEHSHQLGLVAWYLSEKLRLGLDKGKIFEYAAVHDLVEVYAGDTDPYNSSPTLVESKSERELQGLEKIRNRFPDFPQLADAIKSYESRAEKESRLVYAVDKMLPVMNTLVSNDTYYVDSGVTFERWKALTKGKLENVDAGSLLGEGFIVEFVSFIEGKEPLLFAQERLPTENILQNGSN